MSDRHAIVAGATGIVGSRVAERLSESGWRVTGLSRRIPTDAVPYAVCSVDLTNPRDCAEKLASFSDVTHVVYAARYDHPEGVKESVDTNAAMLENLIDAIEPAASSLEHVHIVHGTKYYGHMLGPVPVPLTEESPRAHVANFYFAHEDFIRERQRGQSWSYSTSRPHTFCDPSVDEPRNAALLIAVYASLARALDEPFDFPGTQASFHARTQFTFVPMLARAIEWMLTTPACANQAYNIVNGDAPRWSELWPAFADYFGVESGAPRGFRVRDYVGDKGVMWEALVREHALQPGTLESRVLWPYADYLFSPEWDIISSASKAQRHGFSETLDSSTMFLELFDTFRAARIIP